MTELCDGTLHDLVISQTDSMIKLTSDRLKKVVLRQITEGVKHLHDINILHRDLKPKNILYRIISDKSGKRPRQLVMKVADFGCSRSIKGDDTHYTRTLIGHGYSQYIRPFGTDGWIAPEVLNGAKELRPPHAIDINPLGLIFAFTLCGGQHPYGEDATARDEQMKNKNGMLEIIQQQLMKFGDNFEYYNLINGMLHPNPEKRPTAAEILESNCIPSTEIKDWKVLCNTKHLYLYDHGHMVMMTSIFYNLVIAK